MLGANTYCSTSFCSCGVTVFICVSRQIIIIDRSLPCVALSIGKTSFGIPPQPHVRRAIARGVRSFNVVTARAKGRACSLAHRVCTSPPTDCLAHSDRGLAACTFAPGACIVCAAPCCSEHSCVNETSGSPPPPKKSLSSAHAPLESTRLRGACLPAHVHGDLVGVRTSRRTYRSLGTWDSAVTGSDPTRVP